MSDLYDLDADQLHDLDATDLPSGDHVWMRERGLSRTFMDWLWHDDEHDPITAETWSAAVALLNRVPLADPPPVLLVALPDDERLVLLDVATDAEKRQAIRTALVTACRLHDALVEELLTARALLAGDAG